jgi:Xaa-Pro aminopeptidase
MWASHLLGLQRAVPDASFTTASPVISRLRAVKDADELAALARAARAADESFRQICSMRFEGRNEQDVAHDLEDLLVRTAPPLRLRDRRERSERRLAPPRAERPHDPARDAVVMDFGGEFGGYFSDTTRTVVVGEPPPGFPEVYDAVRRGARRGAGGRAARRRRAGRRPRGSLRDRGARLRRAVHPPHRPRHRPRGPRAPWIVEGNDLVLDPGMTFSVEPGIYLDGRFGVRIEDIVAVSADGVDRLNRSTRDLQAVD